MRGAGRRVLVIHLCLHFTDSFTGEGGHNVAGVRVIQIRLPVTDDSSS